MIKFEKLPPDISSRIVRAKEALAEDTHIIFAYLFGGLAKGAQNPLSDVDIAVYLKQVDRLSDFKLKLFGRLSDALGTSEIDLVILNHAPISLAGRILNSREVLVDKEPFLRYDYESLTLREFFDFKTKEETLLLRRYGLGR
jgi:predicted nucleotidyltransferase